MIDEHGYRANVGIIICNSAKQVLLAKRAGFADSWQFPQGGMSEGETPQEAMYRELYEELGLTSNDVALLQESQHWLHYDLPEKYIRHHQRPVCIGQKQRWFLLQLTSGEQCINLEQHDEIEFDDWRWASASQAVRSVIDFKREVYQQALIEFELMASKS